MNEVEIGDVGDQTSDEIQDGEREGGLFFGVMVEPGIERAVIAEMSELFWELQLAEPMLLAKEVDDLLTPHDFERLVVERWR